MTRLGELPLLFVRQKRKNRRFFRRGGARSGKKIYREVGFPLETIKLAKRSREFMEW
jgi:hypothetical protein